MMIRHLRYGIKKLVFLRIGYSDLVRKIISGNMAQGLADLALRFTTIVVKSMAAVSRAALSDVTVTDTWRFGIMYLHSLTMTDMVTIQS